jgi:hypothetical protein
MRRTLLRSPAFARALRAWLKSRPGAAEAVEATLEQLSADISASCSSLCSTKVPKRFSCSPWGHTTRCTEAVAERAVAADRRPIAVRQALRCSEAAGR